MKRAARWALAGALALIVLSGPALAATDPVATPAAEPGRTLRPLAGLPAVVEPASMPASARARPIDQPMPDCRAVFAAAGPGAGFEDCLRALPDRAATP